MRIEQLEEALDRYGGDLARFPASLRAEAETLIATDASAARIAAVAARLDGALYDAVRPIPMDAAIVGRIVASIGDGGSHDVVIRPTRRFAAIAGAAMVAFLATGYAVGLALPASQGEDAFAGLMFGNSATTTETGDVL